MTMTYISAKRKSHVECCTVPALFAHRASVVIESFKTQSCERVNDDVDYIASRDKRQSVKKQGRGKRKNDKAYYSLKNDVQMWKVYICISK